jgi:hypothetical protein
MDIKKLEKRLSTMKVESWEMREHSNGNRKLYVRYVPDAQPVKTKIVKKA